MILGMQRSSSEPLQHENEAYSNFVDSFNSEQTREMYVYSLSKFLKHYEIDLDSFLSLGQQEISNHIINYLVNKKISRQYKIVIFSAIKHACEMNDVILNWKKLKKKYYDKQGNEINDPDLIEDIQRGATVISYHEEKSGEDSSTINKKRRIVRR